MRQIDGDHAVCQNRIDTNRRLAEGRENQLKEFPAYKHDVAEAGFAEVAGTVPPVTLDNVEQLAHQTGQTLQGKISYEQRRVNDASEKMIAGMSEFLGQFPEFGQTLSVGRSYAESFAAVLHRIEGEDLPRHRERFEHYLNENLVGDLLMLNRRLEEHQETIEERINEINTALRGIDYSEDTYVQLRLLNRSGHEVAEFRRSLRGCFEHGISPAPEERLQIFERVRQLLEYFQRDPEETQRVTDVRTWFAAGVRELRRTDDSEANFYAATTESLEGKKLNWRSRFWRPLWQHNMAFLPHRTTHPTSVS